MTTNATDLGFLDDTGQRDRSLLFHLDTHRPLQGWVEKKVRIPFFFTFFTFLGNPPLKSSNPPCSRYTHPPTMNITPLCCPHSALHGGVVLFGLGEFDKND